jgi:HK97 family phage portal protein
MVSIWGIDSNLPQESVSRNVYWARSMQEYQSEMYLSNLPQSSSLITIPPSITSYTGGESIYQVKETAAAETDDQRSLGATSSLANPSLELVRLFGGSPSVAGVDLNENTAMSISTVWACIRNLAEDVAGSPWDVFERSGSRTRKRVINHPLYRLMAVEPNPELSPFEFRQAMTANAVLWGQGYAEIERLGDGTPIALWPIQPWRIVPMRDRNNLLYYQVDTIQKDGTYKIQPYNMLRIGGFSNNGLVGFWLAREAKDSWGLAMAAERFACTFYGNGTQSGGWIETPGKLSEQAKKNLRESIERQHRGADRAFRLMIYEAGLKYHEAKVNAQESQALESRQFQVEEIARWFRMPPHMIQSMARATFNNIEHQAIEYVNFTLHAWYMKWEQEAKKKLCRMQEVSDGNLYGIHDFTHLLRGDQVAQATADSKLVLGCISTPNERRSLRNMDPVEGGDILLAPANYTSLDGLRHAANVAKAEAATALDDAGLDPTEATDPDDIPGGIVDQAEGEPVLQSPLRPPPLGVVPPGQQPGLDSSFTGFRSLIKVQSPLLVEAVKRLLHTEKDKCIRAAKKDGFPSWSEAFYKDHSTHVRAAISPVIQMMVDSTLAVGGKTSTPELRAKVQGSIEKFVAGHVESSRSDLVDLQELPRRLSCWEEARVAPFVESVVEQLEAILK